MAENINHESLKPSKPNSDVPLTQIHTPIAFEFTDEADMTCFVPTDDDLFKFAVRKDKPECIYWLTSIDPVVWQNTCNSGSDDSEEEPGSSACCDGYSITASFPNCLYYTIGDMRYYLPKKFTLKEIFASVGTTSSMPVQVEVVFHHKLSDTKYLSVADYVTFAQSNGSYQATDKYVLSCGIIYKVLSHITTIPENCNSVSDLLPPAESLAMSLIINDFITVNIIKAGADNAPAKNLTVSLRGV